MAPIIAISQHLARGWSSLHPIFKERRRKSFNYPEKFLPYFSNLKTNCGRWAKEQFISIYTDPKTAMRTLKEWIIAAIKSKIPAFVELGYKFFRKRHYLLNYFLCKITTAISEGINNKIKRLSRMAYGY